MNFRHQVTCPDGYLPIARPKEWYSRSGSMGYDSSKSEITIMVRDPEITIASLKGIVAKTLTESFQIDTACLNSLARNPVNDFIIRVNVTDDDLMLLIKPNPSSYSSNGVKDFNLWLGHVIIFQRMKTKLL